MKGDLRLRQSDDLELVERMAEAGWNAIESVSIY
jgi:hypothetical protein